MTKRHIDDRARAKRLPQLLLDAKRGGWAPWIRGEADERALLNGCYFEAAAAQRVRDFYRELLVHSKGSKFAGQPFELLPWQYDDVVGPLFGWKRADGSRRFRRAYIEIPKKNGKSTLASGISLYMLVGDREPGAECYSCATDRDQAKIVYGEAANMVDTSPDLSVVLDVRRSTNRILYPEMRSWYEAISADADSAEGKNAHLIVIDELHAWRGREFFESLIYAGRAREQPLMLIITTAGDDITGVCYEEHEKAERIGKGEEFLEHCFGYIRSADPEDDWTKERTWKKANPSYGITINPQDFANDCAEAQAMPRKAAMFKRYSLDLWIGSSEAWLPMDLWSQGADQFELADFERPPLFGGMDLSRTQDLSAYVWVIPDGGLYYLVERLFMPEGLVREKERSDKVPYQAWIDEGWITATDGAVVDYSFIRQAVLKDAEDGEIVELGYDPHNAEYLCNQQLREKDGVSTIAIPQTMPNMGPPSTALEALLKAQRIRHRNNPCLNWMVSCAAVFTDTNNNIRPVKKRSRGRIDGLVAAIIALGRALPAEGSGGSFYDDHDLESG